MSKGHLEAGEVINLSTLKPDMSESSTYALVKTDDMEVIRMVVPAGREIDKHTVEGEASVQCLKGTVQFYVGGQTKELNENDWLYLNRGQTHSLRAETDAVLLVTILFTSGS